jgi:hypothetical protein
VRAFGSSGTRHGGVEGVHAQQRAAEAASKRSNDRDDAPSLFLLCHTHCARPRGLAADVHDIGTVSHHAQRGVDGG